MYQLLLDSAERLAEMPEGQTLHANSHCFKVLIWKVKSFNIQGQVHALNWGLV